MAADPDVIILDEDESDTGLNEAFQTFSTYSDDEDNGGEEPTVRGLPAAPGLALKDENLEIIDLQRDDAVFIRELSPAELQAAHELRDYQPIDHAMTQYSLKVVASSPKRPFHVENVKGDFMRVETVLQHRIRGQVLVQGQPLCRVRRVQSFFKRDRNELCAMLRQEYREGQQETTDLNSTLITWALEDIVQAREIVYTNKHFPEESFRDNPKYFSATHECIEETAVLVCRRKYIELYDPRTRKVVEEVILNLTEAEADRGKGVADLAKKNHFRGSSGASSSPTYEYKYGDICAGGGGTTRAAIQQNFDVKFVLDDWHVACQTLRRNFPDAKVLEFSINDFCVKLALKKYMLVDHLHISYPCQAFCLANRGGKNDEKNQAAGFSVMQLLPKCRPRIVSFEQTWSILTAKHRPYFEALIHGITCMGYNVRWKIIMCHELANVQPRKRLFILASCPGEPLPPFPKKTHGPFPLLPYVTIADCLNRVPPHIPHHMQQFTPKNSAPYNANTMLRQAITCNGGEGDKHPDGGRSFILQELASLQAFPPEHEFVGTKTDIRKQIGNAVPCVVAKAIFAECQKSMRNQDLKERDRIGGARNPLTID